MKDQYIILALIIVIILLSMKRVEKMKVENLDIKRSECKNANIVKYRDWVITFLKQQVMLRDNILIEQKFLLDKNCSIPMTIDYWMKASRF